VYARWRRPRRFDRNLLVIGGGAAGLVTAYIAATVKARVTLIEAHKMGGDCLNHGCVPSKALIEVARLAHAIRHAPRQGLVVGEPVVDFRRVMARVQAAIRQIEPHDSIERYTGLGVEVLEGRARLVDPWTVAVALKQGGRAAADRAQHRARHRCPATGAAVAGAGGGGLSHQRHPVGAVRHARCAAWTDRGAGWRSDRL
jgi:pyruvate/2-oxoglutarate dehydrogenase complex dihydrolipoamide dehydrogenase (E3) component